MMGPREIPPREHLVDYNYAVAGHAGTLCDPDGELFVKPCKQEEIDFYEAAASKHPRFYDLMPLFMGVLTLNDATDVGDINEQLPVVADHLSQEMKEAVVDMAHQMGAKSDPDRIAWKSTGGRKIKTDKALVLENTTYGYKEPNIVDVKLGRRLWADDAPAEKRVRFDAIRRETTHEQFGFRIAGMRVYKGSENTEELDPEGYKIYDKDWGRFEVNNNNILEAFRKFIFNKSAGVDTELGKIVAGAFKTDLEHVRDVLESEKSRMYSSSLLFVFEGDGAALRSAIEETSASAAASEKGKGIGGPSNIRVDSGIVVDDDGELISVAGQAFESTDCDEEDEEANLPKIYGLKLIDFAHAEFLPEEREADENVLHGVRCLIEIFDELSK